MNWRQGPQLWDKVIADINYSDKVRQQYSNSSKEELAGVVKTYESKSFFTRLLDKIAPSPQSLEYRIVKEMLKEKKD